MSHSYESLWKNKAVLPPSLGAVVSVSVDAKAAVGFLAFLIAYYFGFRYATAFGVGTTSTFSSPFWFPDAILLCALLKSRRDLWWLFILATPAIRLLVGGVVDNPLWVGVTAAAIDAGQVLATAVVLQRFMRNPLRFETLRDLAVFVLFAVILFPAVSAFVAAAARGAEGVEFWTTTREWGMGDALAQLVVVPTILYWVFGAAWRGKTLEVKRLGEAALLTAGLVLSTYWCFIDAVTFSDPSFYAPAPFLFWAAFRFGMAGASGSVAILATFIVYCALMRHGPFANLSPALTPSALQIYILERAAPVLFLASLIEEKLAGERSLRESEARFRSIANTAPSMLWVVDADKLCTFVNDGWLQFRGRTFEQELGTGWTEGIHPDDLQHAFEVYNASCDARRLFEVEYRVKRFDGVYRWVWDVGRPRFSSTGEFIGYAGCVLDITDRKDLEQKNRNLAHVQRLAVMGEFLATIAHELRQPLATIMSNADAARIMLESGVAPSDEIGEIVTDIRSANLRANAVLEQLRDFLRKHETEKQQLDLNTVVSDVLLLVTSDAQRRRIQIRTELGEGLPLVLGSRTQIQQVLLNLFVNATDAMLETDPEKRYLTIRTSKPNGDSHVEVAVVDAGFGIPPANLPRLFESFFTTRADGMGLGLSIARSIVESHGGRIWAHNNPTGGATFSFTLEEANQRRRMSA
jgi:PAS domain S-box-containing protein